MRAWVKFTALLLVAAWFPASSHAWLETVGLIHSSQGVHHETDHEAANGHCEMERGDLAAKIPTYSAHLWIEEIIARALAAAAFASIIEWPAAGSTAPPELLRTWQFAERRALPARAPSVAV